MSLPLLNNITYDLILPSTGETLNFRPFLVKEQKALLIAQESEDNKQIEKAFAQIINDCIIDDIDPYIMPMFDIEYVFLQLRGKSVGEKITLNVLCPDDNETRVDVEVDLDQVGIQQTKDHTNVIELAEGINLVMRYPNLGDMQGFDEQGDIKSIFEMIKRCVHEIHDGETVHHRVDMSEKDLEAFLDSMSTTNFESVGKFFETMPKLVHVIEVKNPKTKKKNKIPLEGLQSFFE
jgi:hypothetical protein